MTSFFDKVLNIQVGRGWLMSDYLSATEYFDWINIQKLRWVVDFKEKQFLLVTFQHSKLKCTILYINRYQHRNWCKIVVEILSIHGL